MSMDSGESSREEVNSYALRAHLWHEDDLHRQEIEQRLGYASFEDFVAQYPSFSLTKLHGQMHAKDLS